jgi:hypothetical protein
MFCPNRIDFCPTVKIWGGGARAQDRVTANSQFTISTHPLKGLKYLVNMTEVIFS